MSTGSITSLGLGSGLDIQSILDQLREVDQQPIDAKSEEVADLEEKGLEIDAISATLLTMRTNAVELSMGSNFFETDVSVSGTSIEATAITSSDDLSHTVDVTALASFSSWTSEGMASKTEIITSTDMTLSYQLGEEGNPIYLDVEAGTTLEELVSLINEDKSNPGITASIVDTGIGDNPYKLVLRSDESGEENRIFIETQLLSSAPESNVATTISESNLLEISGASGNNEIVFQERTDDGSLGLVETLSTLMTDLDEKSNYDIDTGEKGIFFGENSINRIDDELKSFLERELNIDGTITSMYDLGLTIESDGTLSIDTEVLEEALSSNAEDVTLFFTGDSEEGITGFGDLLYEKIKSYTGTDGLLSAEGDAVQTRITKLEEEIENDTTLLEKRYETLTNQYIAMDTYIQEMESQGSYLEQMFGSSDDD